MAETRWPADVPTRKATKRRGPGLNIFLFIATLCSTWLAGLGGDTLREAAINGCIYTASVISILLSHEMGHYILARRNRVDASLPYFIPFPLGLFGTLGAVIVMRGRIRSRNALMEVGAAGPLAGMAVAVPILIVGLTLSEVAPLGNAGILEGQSILYLLLKRIAVGHIPTGHDVYLHPMAWAGWIGLLVTMLNLFPIGQLDGGHIAYALWGNAHARISRLFFRGLFILGLSVIAHEAYYAWQQGLEGEAFWIRAQAGVPWLSLGLLLFIFLGRKKGRGFKHPPTDDVTLSSKHRAVGIACIALFIITFMPIPLRILM